MLSIPLPFVVVLGLAMFFLKLVFDDRPWTVSRKAFASLIMLCIIHGTLTGLVWNYGISAVRPLLPITGSIVPLLTWFAFRTLSVRDPRLPLWEVALRLIPTGLVILAEIFSPLLIDPVIIFQFIYYSIVLWRMSRPGPDGFQSAQLHRTSSAWRAAQGAALLLIFNACVDLGIIVDFQVTGGKNVLTILSGLSVLILLLIGWAALTGIDATNDDADEESDEKPAGETTDLVETIDYQKTASQVDALLFESRLYIDPNLTLVRIARKAGIPAREISTAINRHHGMNVSQYVNGYRLNEACRLLSTTDDSITNIHLDSGFQTKSNFNREFRRQYGCSPSEWRQNHQHAGVANAQA